MEILAPITILRWNDEEYPVFKMDKFVASEPQDGILKLNCAEFAVWRKKGSLSRYYMLKKSINRKLVNLLVNKAHHDSR